MIMDTEIKQINDNDTPEEEYISHFIERGNLIDQWILLKTPYPTLLVLSLYLLFVLKIGPRYMKHRRAYDINILMRLYNIGQVLANLRLLYYPFVAYAKDLPYILKLSCNVSKETDENIDELILGFIYLLHGYLVLKILDLLDTVFMVLRKKNSQITFLHVYHHGIMVFGSWYTIKYFTPVHAVLPGIINVIVHIVMYSYFFLATFGEPAKKYLWWKKYLTKLQLAQFVFDLAYITTLYYNGCLISKSFTYFWLFNVFVFLCLFANFYVRAYIMKRDTVQIDKSLKKNDMKRK